MVDPFKPNDPAPWTPSSDSNGGSSPNPGYAADPALAMLWTTAPPIDGMIQQDSTGDTGKTSGSSQTANPHGPISVGLGSFAAAEDAMLPITSQLVDGYNNLRQFVLDSLNTPGFFGENAMYSHQTLSYANDPGSISTVGDNGSPNIITEILPDVSVQDMANQFDQSINPAMSRCLRQVADSITAVGHFINVMNLIPQLYCMADKASYFPPPGAGQPPSTTPHA